mgnify:CR=1 FL=1
MLNSVPGKRYEIKSEIKDIREIIEVYAAIKLNI